MFYVFNTQPITDVRKRPVSSIEEYVSTYIVLQPYPFPLRTLQSVSAMFKCGECGGRKKMKRPLFSQTGLSSLIHLLRWTVALSNTTKVSWGMRKEKSSRKPTILSAVIGSVVVNPSYWLSRVIIPKMLSLATLWEGTNMSSPLSCHPYGT